MTVPTTALVQVGKSAFVDVAAGANAFVPQQVVTGEQRGDRIVIRAGLKAGATIVAREAVLLQ